MTDNSIIVTMLIIKQDNPSYLGEKKVAVNLDQVKWYSNDFIDHARINRICMNLNFSFTERMTIAETFGELLEIIAQQKNPKKGWTIL